MRRRKDARSPNGDVDLETGEIMPMRAPERPRGTATLAEAKDAGRRLGEDEIRRRKLEGGAAERLLERAVNYAEIWWERTGTTPL